MNLAIEDIIKATGARVVSRGATESVTAISTDSRTIVPGSWFVAIKGPHFDGHEFVSDVAARGATGCVVDRDVQLPATDDGRRTTAFWCLRVHDTVTALGAIAGAYRAQFRSVPCVAITGSNGKSTTKEMVAAVAQSRGPVLKTEGNFNNLIGLPLTVFRWNESHKTAVLEMGMSAKGEIARLAEIIAPDVGIVTNVTAAHLEELQTIENVAAAKAELFETMRKDGTVCVNMEDPFVKAFGLRYPGRKITFGIQNGCDVQFGRMASEGFSQNDLTVYVHGAEHRFSLHAPGIHNVMNALAAIAAGLAIEIGADEICARLPQFQPMKMRMERVQLANGVQVVNDSYNANPLSMEAALRTVSAVKRAGQFVAVLGDMLELGPQSVSAHKTLGAMTRKYGVQTLFIFGDRAHDVADGAIGAGMSSAQVHVVADIGDLQKAVLAIVKSGDVLLVKGSRGMKMERVVEFLKEECGTG